MFILLTLTFTGCSFCDEQCDEEFEIAFTDMSQHAERLEEELARAEAELARLEDQQVKDREQAARLNEQYGKLWFVAETFIAQSPERGEFLMVCPVNQFGNDKLPRMAVVSASQYNANDPDCVFYAISYNNAGVPSLVLN